MEKIKTVIIDDEKNSLEVLENIIGIYCPNIVIIETFQDPRNALIFLLKNEIDLVFLDINMPYMTGIELLKKIPSPFFYTIFTTAFDQYAIDAIKLSAKDYLLKPIDPLELVESIDKISFILKKVESKDTVLSKPPYGANKLVIHQLNNILFIDHPDIICLKADNNYTEIRTKHKKVVASKTIKHFESLLPDPPFYRCHQSYIVNLGYIKEYSKTDQSIVMKNGTMIPLSKNKKEGLFKHLVH